ncbi:MAG: ECF transporter S component [Jatrophihabitans sp.]
MSRRTLGVRRPTVAIRVGPRTVVAITLAAFLGLVAFFWPFAIDSDTIGSTDTAPLMFGVLLVLVLAVLIAQISEGGIDSKALALLGVLSAVNAALRPLGAGTAGIETVFFMLVLAGRVMGPGFGFTLGCTSLFASALITGGVGPWMPYQMFGCAFVGLGAGLLPRARGKAELVLLAGYAAFSSYLFGFLLNLSFWPFALGEGTTASFLPGAPLHVNVHRYLLFDATTSLGWDTGRAITTTLCVLIVGPPVLGALRRAARRAAFEAPVEFIEPDGRDEPDTTITPHHPGIGAPGPPTQETTVSRRPAPSVGPMSRHSPADRRSRRVRPC